MINISKPLFLMSLLLSACGNAAARQPERLQGIVEHEERILAFEVGGRVKELPLERGQSVNSGGMLGVLDDGLERPLRDARAAELAAVTAQLRLLEAGPRGEEIRGVRAQIGALRRERTIAQAALDRQLALAASGASAAVQRDAIDTQIAALDGQSQSLSQQLLALRRGARTEEIDAAEARVEASAAALTAIDARLARYTLYSPMHATILDRHVSVGEVVAPGTPAFTVADLDRPYVDVFVPEGRMRAIRVGMSADVRVDGVRQTLRGRVEHVSNHTEFTPRFLFSEKERPNLVLRVRIRIEDPNHRLFAGVPAFVSIAGLR